METRINAEVLQMVRNLDAAEGQPVDPKECVSTAVSNVISNILFGHGLDKDLELKKASFAMAETIIETGFTFVILDILPAFRFLPYLKRLIDKGNAIQNSFFHQINKKVVENRETPTTESFLLSFIRHEGEGLDREQINYTIRDLILAGTETSTTTVLWAIALLADHQEVQQRMRDEIDAAVQRDRQPSLDDKKNLPFVEAAILEIMRYKTLVPVGVPHATMCDTEVGGCFIPSGTMVFSNLYAAHMDPDVWDKPHEFRPERFLNEAGDVINRDLMIAFSLGKRSCLGELLARQEVYLFITGLVQQFHIRPPEGQDRVNVQERARSTVSPTPFQVCFIV